MIDFTLSPQVEETRLRIRNFVEKHVIPLESDPDASEIIVKLCGTFGRGAAPDTGTRTVW